MSDQRLSELNQHPLNQAAKRRLESLGQRAGSGLLHLLDLAHAGLDEADEGGERDSPRWELAKWGRSPAHQESALAALEEELEPEWVAEASPENLAETVVGILRASSNSPGVRDLT